MRIGTETKSLLLKNSKIVTLRTSLLWKEMLVSIQYILKMGSIYTIKYKKKFTTLISESTSFIFSKIIQKIHIVFVVIL